MCQYLWEDKDRVCLYSVEYMYVIYMQNSFYEGICYQIKLI